MRLAFISDIHGNATALEAVLEDIKPRDVDKMFFLGDLCYRGLEPMKSLDLVRSLDTDVIKGNADEWVVRGITEGEVPESVHPIMDKEREWTVSKLDEESIEYLDNLPEKLNLSFDNVDIYAFHATPNSLFDVVAPDENDETLKEKMIVNKADIYIYGHIHKPYIRFINGKCIINTGSVGLPFDGLDKASYVIVDIEQGQFDVSIVRISYNLDKVLNQVQQSDYPNKQFLESALTYACV